MLTLWLCQKILCFFGSEMFLLLCLWSLLSYFSSWIFFRNRLDLFHLLSPTSHLFFLITILVLALSSPLWSKSEVKVEVAQSGLALYGPMDYTVLGILQARIEEWVAYPFSSRAPWPRNWTGVPTLIIFFFQIYFCLFFFWLHYAAWEILVPPRGIKPVPPALEAQILNHWTTRAVPIPITLDQFRSSSTSPRGKESDTTEWFSMHAHI